MTAPRFGRVGVIAIMLAVIGGVLALVNEFVHYREGDAVDWGHVALAFGVPALMYALVRGSAGRR